MISGLDPCTSAPSASSTVVLWALALCSRKAVSCVVRTVSGETVFGRMP